MAFAQGAPPLSLDQSLKAQYPFGAVLIVRADGLIGVNSDCSQPNDFSFKDGRLHAPGFLQKLTLGPAGPCTSRPFPVGSKAMLATYMVVLPRFNSLSLSVLQCDGCDNPAQDQRVAAAANNSPTFRAGVSFQFPKGFLVTATLEAVRNAIEQVFTIDTGANTSGGPAVAPPTQGGITGRPSPTALGSSYVNSQNNADRLKLNPDGSFSLQEGGQAFNGTYVVDGDTLKLHILQMGKDVDIAIHGNTLIVNGQEAWDRQPESNDGPFSRSASRLVGAYAKPGNTLDRLQLNADGSFLLQERGRAFHGTFVVDGNRLILKMAELSGQTSIATTSGDGIIDDEGHAWVRQTQ